MYDRRLYLIHLIICVCGPIDRGVKTRLTISARVQRDMKGKLGGHHHRLFSAIWTVVMSKPTSQEIIDSGSYLEPFFDPSTLLVVNLRAILQHHDIQFPANATKPVLIKHFNDEIAPNAQELRRQKRAADGIPSDASDILNAETGEYLEVRRVWA